MTSSLVLSLKKQLTSCTRSQMNYWRVQDSTWENSLATHPDYVTRSKERRLHTPLRQIPPHQCQVTLTNQRRPTREPLWEVLRHFTQESRRYWGWGGMLTLINLWSVSMRLPGWQGVLSLLSRILSVWWASSMIPWVSWHQLWWGSRCSFRQCVKPSLSGTSNSLSICYQSGRSWVQAC